MSSSCATGVTSVSNSQLPIISSLPTRRCTTLALYFRRVLVVLFLRIESDCSLFKHDAAAPPAWADHLSSLNPSVSLLLSSRWSVENFISNRWDVGSLRKNLSLLVMAAAKLTRIPSMRERVEDTLSAHRNELVALLSRFSLAKALTASTDFFLLLSSVFFFFCLATTHNWAEFCRLIDVLVSLFFGRYVAQGKGILQPHHLVDELENIIGYDESKKALNDGPFSEVLRCAQVLHSVRSDHI